MVAGKFEERFMHRLVVLLCSTVASKAPPACRISLRPPRVHAHTASTHIYMERWIDADRCNYLLIGLVYFKRGH